MYVLLDLIKEEDNKRSWSLTLQGVILGFLYQIQYSCAPTEMTAT